MCILAGISPRRASSFLNNYQILYFFYSVLSVMCNALIWLLVWVAQGCHSVLGSAGLSSIGDSGTQGDGARSAVDLSNPATCPGKPSIWLSHYCFIFSSAENIKQQFSRGKTIIFQIHTKEIPVCSALDYVGQYVTHCSRVMTLIHSSYWSCSK